MADTKTATATTTAAAQTSVTPPKIPTGQEIFDAIMSHIEPELTSEGLKTLEAKYADETPDETAARKQRYELAFERYEQAYEGYIETLHTQVTRFCKTSFAQAEMEQYDADGKLLQQLDHAFLQAA